LFGLLKIIYRHLYYHIHADQGYKQNKPLKIDLELSLN
jgi:hypothetical protein